MIEKPRNVGLPAAGALSGDPGRAGMLIALADDRALPAGELASRADASPATATMHLRRLDAVPIEPVPSGPLGAGQTPSHRPGSVACATGPFYAGDRE